MPLINCKVHLELNWIEDCILSSAGDSAKFKIADAKLHVPIVTLSTINIANLTNQLIDGFKRFVYWNNYQTISAKVINNSDNDNIYKLASASFQGVRRLFFLAYYATDDNEAGIKYNKKYFLPKFKITDYNVLINGKIFYDQPVNDLIKQYDEVRKVSTGQGDDYNPWCLLNYAHFKESYRLIVVDLSKWKALGTDPRVIQQILFKGKTRQRLRLYTILENSK